MYQRIIVPLDGSDLAEQVLPHVQALAQRFSSKLTLIWATESPEMIIEETLPATAVPNTPPDVVDPMPAVDAEHREASHYLAAIASKLREQGIATDYEHPEGHPSDVIVDAARRLGADLIAMSTHGRGGLDRVVFGSVADAVLHHAPCPLLLVRARKG